MDVKDINELSNKIIGIAIEIHKTLKAGFNEKIYQEALQTELKNNNIKFDREKIIKVKYKDKLLGEQRIDFIVEDEIILEIKSTKMIGNIHIAQILSYLKTLNKRLGLILNFGESKLGVKRVANGL
ncbi:MAG: GxxExxY protein [Nitrospirae bacterium]|nr:GxxExxY protein [Nitrospirota bacterium]